MWKSVSAFATIHILLFFISLPSVVEVKMKSLLIFLFVIATAFAMPKEQNSPGLPFMPWYPNENSDPTIQATSTPLV